MIDSLVNSAAITMFEPESVANMPHDQMVAHAYGYSTNKKPPLGLTTEELNDLYVRYHDQYGESIDKSQNGWAYERAICTALMRKNGLL